MSVLYKARFTYLKRILVVLVFSSTRNAHAPGKQAEKGVPDTDHEDWPCHLHEACRFPCRLECFLDLTKLDMSRENVPWLSGVETVAEESDSLRSLLLPHGLTAIPAPRIE